MEWLKGNSGRAIEDLQHYLSMIAYQSFISEGTWLKNDNVRRGHCLFLLALAHNHMGDFVSAIRELEEISTLTYGRIWNPQTLARSYLLAGQLYQKLGQRDKALEKYRLFVDLWKDCDPPLKPLVNETRREMEKLEKQR